MTFDGAVIKEQGVTFAVVVVRKPVIDDRSRAASVIVAFETQVFAGTLVILMAQDARGTPVYYGRDDIARFMASVDPAAIPWKRYTVQL
jgi:hypothetical protein